MNARGIIFLLVLCAACSRDILTYHGQQYHKVVIGEQTWMKENLATTSYRFGEKIPVIKYQYIWPDMVTPACGYYNNDTSMLRKYGMLYNWYAVNGGKLCPPGWRIPTNKDWEKLEEALGGHLFAGGRMKSDNGWFGKHVSGDDAGFSALPGGYRLNEDFQEGKSGKWWSQTVAANNDFMDNGLGQAYRELLTDDVYIYGRSIGYSSTEINTTLNRPNNGFSVRCVKSRK